MVALTALIFLLQLVLSTSREQEMDTCVELIDNPKSVFSQSKNHDSPIAHYLVDELGECMDNCCGEEPGCNVGIYLEDTPSEDANCFLYECDPVSSCSLKIKKGTQVFARSSSLEENGEVNEDSPTPLYEENDEEQETDYTDEETNDSEEIYAYNGEDMDAYNAVELGENNNENNAIQDDNIVSSSEAIDSSIDNLIPYLDTYDTSTTLHIPTSTPYVPDTSDSSDNEEGLKQEENFVSTNQDDFFTFTPILATSSDIYTTQSDTVFTNNDYQITPSSTISFEDNTDDISVGTESLEISNTVLDSPPMILPSELQISSSQITFETDFDVALTTAVTPEDVVTSSLVVMESTTTSGENIASDIYTTWTEEDARSSTTPGPSKPTNIPQTEATDQTSATTAFDIPDANNSSETEDLSLGPDPPDAITISLISALAFGCVFSIAVVGVLGVRIYEGYKKRHYSRLDYLINGMYS